MKQDTFMYYDLFREMLIGKKKWEWVWYDCLDVERCESHHVTDGGMLEFIKLIGVEWS